MPLSLFDLLFLFCALTTIGTLLTALVFAVSGRWQRALSILKRWALAAAVYLAADGISHATMPLRVLYPHDPQCADDWCFVVEKAGPEAPASENYQVDIRIYSRALRVEQRERGLVAYLTGPAGHRYDPVARPGDVPFDTLLQPGQSALATRIFHVPTTARPLDLSVNHGSGFDMGWLIIGRSPYQRTVVRLD